MRDRARLSWQTKCALWTAGGAVASGFFVAAAEAGYGGDRPSLTDRAAAGLGMAVLVLIDGFVVWFPLFLVALASGCLARAAIDFGGPPRQAWLRRIAFACCTAFFCTAFVMAWLHGTSHAFLRALSEAVAPVSFVAALCYCPSPNAPSGLDRYQAETCSEQVRQGP
ncbi:hypothetical protein [Segniliparus rugosus]|uniref:Uncharacterized protein n=1 Tax=Segniliparus rugosus (strain ATCC BAA-974 / DSM 45345 / CCUG 50838 / CIP 108380 / JCM 13579 / CDC 945) TaxID=679197 RepID=E5XPR2_SEGRC|nr:hypothetical protein [Segniliparus rugosus]EFV13660.1 hypothetical protein HMPREF9336_01484 [Segniliparus rugosus ATCC BAA-974]